ncbi:MAG: amidohydrolase family protein [Clostridia bacterium]
MRIYFTNAQLYDGTGDKACKGHLLIEDDRIVSIRFGDAASDVKADQVVNCERLAIAPGFIDAHSHNDWFAARQGKQRFFKPFLEQGITTQVTGNCGFSPFGYERGTKHEPLIGSGLFTHGDAQGDLSTLSGFMAAAGALPVNLHPLLGHMSSRVSLAGYETRALTADELRAQDALLERELEAGAAGLSFGLMYEPDRYATYDELKRAALLAKKYDRPLTVHARACSAASTSYNPPVGGRAHNLRALDEMLRLVRETDVSMQFSHLIFVGSKTWKTVDEALMLIDEINREGHSFFYDSYAMLYGASLITVVLPGWYLTLPKAKRSQPAALARLAVEVGVTKRLLGFDFRDIQITWAGLEHADIVGKNIHEIALLWGISDLRAYLRLVDDTDGKGRVLMYKYLTDEILARLMADDKCLAMTDAWIEEQGMQNPAAFCCFPEFLRIARVKHTFARTIRQMTGATADRFALKERGYLREGYFADLVIFDPDTVAPAADRNGAPIGIQQVYLNGAQVVKDGQAVQDANAGRFILR